MEFDEDIQDESVNKKESEKHADKSTEVEKILHLLILEEMENFDPRNVFAALLITAVEVADAELEHPEMSSVDIAIQFLNLMGEGENEKKRK